MELRHVNYPAVKTNHSPALRTKPLLGAGLRSWNNRGDARSGLEVSWQSSLGQACRVAAHVPTCLAQAQATSPAIMPIFDNKKSTASLPPLREHWRKDGHRPIPLQAGISFQHAKISSWHRHTIAHAATSPFSAAERTVFV